MLAFLYEKNVVHVPAGSKQNGFRKRGHSAILHPDTSCNVTFFDKASMKFKADHSHDTEALYAAASACPPFEISAPLLSNRAQCFLSQEVGSRALADVDCVLRQQPQDQKCLHRRARALLLLPGRLHEASDACSACADGPERTKLRAEILRALAESLGEFNEPALNPGGAGGP